MLLAQKVGHAGRPVAAKSFRARLDLRLDQHRLGPARRDAVDRHAATIAAAGLGIFERGDLAQPDKAELGRHVGRLVHRGHQPVDTGDVDNAPKAARGHRRQSQPHGVERGGQVDADHGIPGGGIGLGKAHRFLNPGVVDKNVDPAPVRKLGHHLLDFGDIAQIGAKEPRLGRTGGPHGLKRRLGLLGCCQPVHGDPHARFRQRLGHAQPDALHRSGHQCRFA